MRLGYIRRIKVGATEDEQRAALTAIGVGKITVERVWKRKLRREDDPTPERTDLIDILRPGDELCVFSALHLARDAGDLFATLFAVAARGAVVYVVDMGDSFTADEKQARIAKAFTGDKRKARMAPARGARKDPGGRPPALADLDRAQWAQFDRDWRDDAISIKQMARKWKVSEATISRKAAARKLGPKA